MKRTCSLVAVIPLVLVSAACGRHETPQPAATASPAPSSSARADLNVCALVTRADVAAIAGITAKEVNPSIGNDMTSRCTFTAEDDTTVDVLIRKLPANHDVDSEIAAMKKGMPGVPFREASGIGERAFFLGGQFNVYHGGSYLLISMLGFPQGPKTDEAARKLAEKVLSQI